MVLFSTILAFFLVTTAVAVPYHLSLAGLSRNELENIIPRLEPRTPGTPPGPLNDTSAKLVNDPAHPWEPLRPGDIRGPCPGLNTLASHGWLPRNGIATPAQIINAVQEGFNMDNRLARFLTYGAFLVDGNLITDLLSIGGKTHLTGPAPPQPAIVGGLDTHAVFEGDTSMTRGDAFFGDNHSFNETLFEEFVAFSEQFGAGKYNLTVAAEFRLKRIQDSIATNPDFSFTTPRYFTAYAESTLPSLLFVDGRDANGQLDLDVARGFFRDSRMPYDFFRTNASVGFGSPPFIEAVDGVFLAHPVPPGRNQGVGNYVPDPTSPAFFDFCGLYTHFVNETVPSLYPDPTGILLTALKTNLDFLFSSIIGVCIQVFPYGP